MLAHSGDLYCEWVPFLGWQCHPSLVFILSFGCRAFQSKAKTPSTQDNIKTYGESLAQAGPTFDFFWEGNTDIA